MLKFHFILTIMSNTITYSLLFGLPALMAIIKGISQLRNRNKIATNGISNRISNRIKTTAKIIRIDRHTSITSPGFDTSYPTVSFKDETGGNHQLKITEGIKLFDKKVGDTIQVIHPPNEPRKAEIYNSDTITEYAYIIGGLLIIVILIFSYFVL